MFKRTVIFTMACCASAAFVAGCGGGDSSSSESVCPETCPTGQHCDDTTGFVCVNDDIIPGKKCPETCPDNQHCDASTDYTCVPDEPEKKCPETCPDNQKCSAQTNFECVSSCPVCDSGKHCDASTDYKCVPDAPPKQCPVCDENKYCNESTGYECIDIKTTNCEEECGEWRHCDEDAGVCVDTIIECTEECGEGRHCDTKVGACADDPKTCAEECQPGLHCDTSKGECVKDAQAGCADECKEGYYCNSKGECAKIEVVKECDTEGALSCSGDLLMVCNSEGSYELKQDCSETGEGCFLDENAVIGCHVSECKPDSTKCSESTVMKCNAVHQYEAMTNCTDDTPICDDSTGSGQCVAKCELGTSRCTIDGKVEVCQESGVYEVASTCDPATSICKMDGEGNASCVEFECTDDALTCNGNVLQKCDNGFITVVTNCEENGMLCGVVNETSTCFAEVCKPGELRCNGNKLEICKNNAFEMKDNCLNSNAFCQVEKGVAKCKVPEEVIDDADFDYDDIPDFYECLDGDYSSHTGCEDTDKDGTPDYMDADSDGDGVPDQIEANNGSGAYEPDDADYDGTPNYRDTDSDGNGIPDSIECCGGDTKCLNAKDDNGLFTYCIDTDGDGILDFLDFDNDNDNATDVDEIKGMVINPPEPEPGKFSGYGCSKGNAFGTPDKPVDCDADTIPDYMDFDSDNDGFCDDVEGVLRMNILVNNVKRGSYSRYNADTDGDTISDAVEAAGVIGVSKLGQKDKRGCYSITKLQDSDGDGIADLLEVDSDNDGLKDATEKNVVCTNGLIPRLKADTDGDGYLDPSEYAVALSVDSPYSPAQLMCDSKIGVKDVYDFYFELPDNSTDDDVLTFEPQVSKLDLVFNVDTTGSMGGTIDSVRKNIQSIITSIKGMVTDSGFALTNFDDFPDVHSNDAYDDGYYETAGESDSGDLPFRVLGAITTEESKAQGYTKNALFTTRYGCDGAESGAESLYQIATGSGVSWKQNSTAVYSVSKRVNPAGTWGGVDFRQNSLPVVIHVSDIYSHDVGPSYDTTVDSRMLKYKECSEGYTTNCAVDPHYTSALIPVLKNKGVRVISLDVGYGDGDGYKQMTAWSRESEAVVPVCAFKTSDNKWNCNGTTTADRCCLGDSDSAPVTVNGVQKQCILKYTGQQASVNEYIVRGVDALVKYGTYNVTTKIRGNVMDNNKNTSCFIDKIVAKAYVPPVNEPEKSCNPEAKATKFSSPYEDGFTNFATGTSTAGVPGAKLLFTVYAKNNGCYPQSDEVKVFTAYIDVYNPTTGLLFDTQLVSIIVPAKEAGAGGEISD